MVISLARFKASEADLKQAKPIAMLFQLKRQAISRKRFRPLRSAIYIARQTIQSQKSR
jgi:hypothetical protein